MTGKIKNVEITVDENLNGISNLRGELTIIIISHDENSLKICDKIIDLDKR